MSADNWAICPKCNAAKIAAKEKQLLDAGASYGKVEPAEYLRMLEAANKPIDSESTLREDYEIEVDTNGEFSVDYRCLCNDCKFAFRYKHSEAVGTVGDKPTNRERKSTNAMLGGAERPLELKLGKGE